MLKSYLAALAVSLLYLLSPSAFAQKSLGDWYENKEFGFKVKSIAKWEQIPTQPGEQYVVAQFSGDTIDITLTKDGGVAQVTPDFYILRFETEVAGPLTTGDSEKKAGEDKAPPSKEDKKKNKEEMEEAQKFRNFQQWLKKVNIPGIRKIGEIKNTKYGKLAVSEQEFLAAYNVGWGVDRHFFVAEFALEGQNIALVYNTPDKQFDKWESVFQKSARSFALIDKSSPPSSAQQNKTDSLDELSVQRLKHQEDVAKVAGWKLDETDHYFIKIHNDDRDFVEEVKQRIELIREKFENDIPPIKPITVKSVLRICKDREEYSKYGGPGNSNGYWYSVTQELVLFDSKERQRNDCLETLNHEAFHQYIFYRCGEINPHTWFNEGTGDYYGGAKLKYGKFEIQPRMKRVDPIREAVQQKKHVTLEKFIRMTQQEYYSTAVAYPQGWSLVYFLKEGKNSKARGWKKEWDQVWPNYLQVLTETKNSNKALDAAIEGLNMTELEEAWIAFVKDL